MAIEERHVNKYKTTCIFRRFNRPIPIEIAPMGRSHAASDEGLVQFGEPENESMRGESLFVSPLLAHDESCFRRQVLNYRESSEPAAVSALRTNDATKIARISGSDGR